MLHKRFVQPLSWKAVCSTFLWRPLRSGASIILLLGLAGLSASNSVASVAISASAAGGARGADHPAQAGPLAIVSAANYSATVAPDSIAAAFGARLASGVEAATRLPLPTTLAGTTVEVNGQLAGLFYVSREQINFLLPTTTAAGTANVVVRSGGVVAASGTVSVAAVAPGIFTANSDGRGAPAAGVYYNSPVPDQPFECVAGRAPLCTPKPIDLCGASGQVTLVLYLTGIRRAPDPNGDRNLNENIRVVIGGKDVVPIYAGEQPEFAGLDQVNVPLPADLANQGLISLTVTAPGNISSNSVDLDFTSTGSVQVNGFSPNNVVAGQAMAIRGAGFSANKEKNTVRILGTEAQAEAQVVDATPTQLTVLIPFGAQSGQISVINLEGQCRSGVSPTAVAVRTSVSGFIKDTEGNKLKGLTVRVRDALNVTRMDTTNNEGAFVIADLAPGNAEVEMDGVTVQGGLPYPKVAFKMRITANRDNQVMFPGSLQAVNGKPSNLGPEGFSEKRSLDLSAPAAPNEPSDTITNGEVILDIPNNSTIRFPDGTPVSTITLSLVGRSLTPVPLPERHFSSTIVQITPIGAIISPGAKLTFPNTDGFPAGTQARLFRLDQQRNSPTLGVFIDAGPATVSSDGRRVETAAGAVTETTYYFVSIPRTTVMVVGRVLDAGQVPVSRALLGSRGQSEFTYGNGYFIVRNVPVNSLTAQVADGTVVKLSNAGQVVVGDDVLSVEANYLRPTRVVSRKENNNVPPGPGNSASAGVFMLDPPPPDNPPMITAPPEFRVFVGQPENVDSKVTPGGGQRVEVSVTGVSFATLTLLGNDTYRIRLSPAAGDRGPHTLVITAVNDLGRVATHRITLTVQ